LISECQVSEPVKFNCWKHHREFIREQLSFRHENFSKTELIKILQRIGESQMDLYLGNLSQEQISSYIIKGLKKIDAFKIRNYYKWIVNSGENFREISLPDKSIWILRKGNERKRYIHIHPGRYSPLSIRVKSLTLKSAIAVILTFGFERIADLFLNDVNFVRKERLNQPPLKFISPHAGQGKMILTLCNKNYEI
jgi:hypothetical protein